MARKRQRSQDSTEKESALIRKNQVLRVLEEAGMVKYSDGNINIGVTVRKVQNLWIFKWICKIIND